MFRTTGICAVLLMGGLSGCSSNAFKDFSPEVLELGAALASKGISEDTLRQCYQDTVFEGGSGFGKVDIWTSEEVVRFTNMLEASEADVEVEDLVGQFYSEKFANADNSVAKKEATKFNAMVTKCTNFYTALGGYER